MKKTKIILAHICSDPVLLAAIFAAFVSALFVPPSREYIKYIDIHVLCLLLSMMLVVSGLQKVGVFGFIIERILKLVHNTRTLAFTLIGICFFSSMLVTNDVALITFVPLGILIMTRIQKKNLMIPIIVLQTVAANLGSMFTPFGNPQNLYLYSVSNMTIWQFLGIMALPTGISFFMLFSAACMIKPELIEPMSSTNSDAVNAKNILPWIVLFFVCLLTVLHIIPYGIALAAVIVGVLIFDRALLLSADYGLLITFAFLFIFIGNIKNISTVSTTLSALVSGREIAVGILLSQVISNVPAAMLLSKFTENYPALLVGVNIGGLGTLIASMASLISYKLYAATDGADKGKYLAKFTITNVLFLGILCTAVKVFSAV